MEHVKYSPIIKVNISNKLGKVEDISLGATCSPEEIARYISLFQECWDIFVWDYFEMLGISPIIVEHHIQPWPDAHPVR